VLSDCFVIDRNRKIKDAEELEAATRLAQQEEMARLQRLQDVQEQVWQQQAVLDLRLYRQNEAAATSLPVSTEPSAITSEASPVVISPTTSLPPSLPISSNSPGVQCSGRFVSLYFCF